MSTLAHTMVEKDKMHQRKKSKDMGSTFNTSLQLYLCIYPLISKTDQGFCHYPCICEGMHHVAHKSSKADKLC